MSACPKCGSVNTKRNGGGRLVCLDCRRSSYVTPDPGALQPIPDGFKAKGTSTLYREDGSIAAQWVKTTADHDRQRAIFEAATEAMAAELPRVAPSKASGDYLAKLLTVYPIGDPHIGMYSWREETGDDWDLTIAEDTHVRAMAALVEAAPPSESALIVNLGDLFHYDSLEAKTPASGHMLDADGRYAKMVAVGVKTMRQCIESALAKHKRVHVINAPGNHDPTGALWLSIALANVYEREPRVTIDRNPSLFAYHRHGKVLLGVHHGHSCKAEKLAGVMAADRAREWGETEYRYWLTGHIHHESRKEYAGVTVESFGTLAAKDAYATNGGWRSCRNMQAIVYHADLGECARSKVHAEMFREQGRAAA